MIVVSLSFNHSEVLSFLLFVLFSLFFTDCQFLSHCHACLLIWLFQDFMFFSYHHFKWNKQDTCNSSKNWPTCFSYACTDCRNCIHVFGLITNASGGWMNEQGCCCSRVQQQTNCCQPPLKRQNTKDSMTSHPMVNFGAANKKQQLICSLTSNENHFEHHHIFICIDLCR